MLFPPLCPDRASQCAPASAGAVIVPPCPNGRPAGCEPWQRDWSIAQPGETDYFEIGGSDDGSRWFIQNLSLVRARGRVEPEIWVQVNYGAVRGTRAQRSLFLVKIQCRARRMGTLSSIQYGPTGNIISDEDVPPDAVRYTDVVDGTISGVILRTACGG
ncbi:MAG: hypothetical protein AB7O91_10130 [Sphingomonas sp.]